MAKENKKKDFVRNIPISPDVKYIIVEVELINLFLIMTL